MTNNESRRRAATGILLFLSLCACGGRAGGPGAMVEDAAGGTAIGSAGGGSGAAASDGGSGAVSSGASSGADGGTSGDEYEVSLDQVVGSCGYTNVCKCEDSNVCEEYIKPTSDQQAHDACVKPEASQGEWMFATTPCPRNKVIAKCFVPEEATIGQDGIRVHYFYEGDPATDHQLDLLCPGELVLYR